MEKKKAIWVWSDMDTHSFKTTTNNSMKVKTWEHVCEFENLHNKHLYYLYTKIYTHSSDVKTCEIKIWNLM